MMEFGSNQKVKVLEIHVHDAYTGGSFDYANDICLVKVESINLSTDRDIVCLPAPGDHVQPDYVRKEPKDMNSCFVGGWGALSSGGGTPDKLQSVAVHIYSDAYCQGSANISVIHI